MEEYKQRELIEEFREEMSSLGETYSNSKTKLTFLKAEKENERKMSLLVSEETIMTITETGVETGYEAKHKLIYEKVNDDWVLLEDQQLDPTGLLPLFQAERFVYNDNTGSTEIEPFPTNGLIAADTMQIRPTDEEKNMNHRTGYNYTAMARYLEKYWTNYNKAYRDFNSKGGDCTNFVSQALYAGGWKMNSGWYKNSNYWWYNSSNQTYSWTAVDYWGSFARNSKRATMLNSVWRLRIGDVLQVKPKNSKQKVHTMMVSYYDGNQPYFTYHTSNRYRRSLKQVLKDWSGSTYYAYRT